MTSIGEFAFVGCNGLTSITIPSSVTSIGDEAFNGCSSLSSINIPNSVTTIGVCAFANCSSLISVNIPEGVTSIESETFSSCSSLISIIIPDGVTFVGDFAFYGCNSLTKIIIPASVEIIYPYAFEDCSSLLSIYAQPTTPPSLYDSSFSEYSMQLNVPSGCLVAYQNAQGWSNFTNVDDGNMYYQLSITVTGHGTATYGTTEVENTTTMFDVKEAANATITITPDEGYNISTVMVGGIDKTDEVVNGVLTLSNITANTTVAVTFAYGGETASLTIGSTGMATFCSTNDLDFSEVNGLKAYVGAGFNRTTGTLTMLEVTDVPAGTGLIVMGNAGNYQVPVRASANVYANLLQGVTTATNISQTADGYTNYILGNGANGLGFYLVSSNGGSLSAGKAYLRIPTAIAGSRSVIDMEFTEGVTGIDNTEAETIANGAYYTLSGLKIEGVPTKQGMYVKDGRIVMVK